MSLPTLVGRDGRRAVPAFTSLAALARWQPSARPMPAAADLVWRAAAAEACSVVIDVAGPVPLAVEGARLAALARGGPVPAPDEDPDVQAAVAAAITEAVAQTPAARALAAAAEPGGALAGFVLHPGVDGGDLLIELAVAPVVDAQELAARVGPAVMQLLGPRLRRGIALALSPPPAPAPARRRRQADPSPRGRVLPRRRSAKPPASAPAAIRTRPARASRPFVVMDVVPSPVAAPPLGTAVTSSTALVEPTPPGQSISGL